jgi:hypothetical protein
VIVAGRSAPSPLREIAHLELGARRPVRRHQGEAAIGLELCVHRLVGDRRVGVAELPEGVDDELAAEDVSVELHRLAGVAIEVDVRVETRRHRGDLPGSKRHVRSWSDARGAAPVGSNGSRRRVVRLCAQLDEAGVGPQPGGGRSPTVDDVVDRLTGASLGVGDVTKEGRGVSFTSSPHW